MRPLLIGVPLVEVPHFLKTHQLREFREVVQRRGGIHARTVALQRPVNGLERAARRQKPSHRKNRDLVTELRQPLRRADAYAQAGADILFVESPESEQEMEKICARCALPLMANMVEGGRTPVLSAQKLAQLGYKIAIFPATGFLAAGKALESVYQTLSRDGSSVNATAPLYDFAEFTKLMGFGQVWEFDKRHAD